MCYTVYSNSSSLDIFTIQHIFPGVSNPIILISLTSYNPKQFSSLLESKLAFNVQELSTCQQCLPYRVFETGVFFSRINIINSRINKRLSKSLTKTKYNRDIYIHCGSILQIRICRRFALSRF